jgi:hypothetical protein
MKPGSDRCRRVAPHEVVRPIAAQPLWRRSAADLSACETAPSQG